MALSTSTVLTNIRTLIDAVSDFARVYSASSNDANALPPALGEFPAVLVLPGDTVEYILSGGAHRHTYNVKVLVLCNQAGERGAAAYQAIPLVDAILEKFAVNIGGTWANSCLLSSTSGFATIEYAGIDYLGWEITLRVSEQASATPAKGA